MWQQPCWPIQSIKEVRGSLTGPEIRKPSQAVAVKLAQVASHVEELLAIDRSMDKTPLGMRNLKNNRRRTVEKVLMLLADPEVRSYLAAVRKLT